MPRLHDLQACFASAVIGGDADAIAAFVADDAPGAAARVAIYANHFRISLIDALAATFPVVEQLMGEEFFRMAGRRFIGAQPPADPRLFAYGSGFPAFLERLEEARSVVYLADVAKLEWAINVARHAAEWPASGRAVSGPAGGATPEGGRQLFLHPSCRLVVSPFPVDRIWRAHQGSCADLAPLDLSSGAVRLLVHRQGEEVGWIDLPQAEAAFLGSLMARPDVGMAIATARTIDAGFDPTLLLAALIEGDLLLTTPPDEGKSLE